MIKKPKKKLKKPTKKFWLQTSKEFYFLTVSNKVDLDVFLGWCKDLPKGSKNITLTLNEGWDYDGISPHIVLEWEEQRTNSNYENDLKKYNKKMLNQK
jgi:uncharacterized protein involved in tellurium resistance